MKRKPAITIRMSAAHGERYHPRAPHLYLGVHLLDGSKEAGGAVPWGLFAPKPSAVAGSYQVQRGPRRPKWPQGLIGESLGGFGICPLPK